METDDRCACGEAIEATGASHGIGAAGPGGELPPIQSMGGICAGCGRAYRRGVAFDSRWRPSTSD